MNHILYNRVVDIITEITELVEAVNDNINSMEKVLPSYVLETAQWCYKEKLFDPLESLAERLFNADTDEKVCGIRDELLVYARETVPPVMRSLDLLVKEYVSVGGLYGRS